MTTAYEYYQLVLTGSNMATINNMRLSEWAVKILHCFWRFPRLKSWIFYSRFKGKRSCDSKLVAMAECSANPDQINPNHCSCEVQQNQPSHSTVEQKVTEEALTKPSKYLPNGKVRLLVDDNGLVTQTALDAERDSYALLQEDVSSNNCYCDINKDDSEINGCRPKNRKSVDCHLSELASEFDTLELENNLKEQTPNVENAESIHDLERDILNGIEYVVYKSEEQMPDIMRLITKDLSEPYSIYTYRYFIHNWPKLCFLVSFTITFFQFLRLAEGHVHVDKNPYHIYGLGSRVVSGLSRFGPGSFQSRVVLARVIKAWVVSALGRFR